jgi:ethanolamine utilization cobalamin adenosyltransferase
MIAFSSDEMPSRNETSSQISEIEGKQVITEKDVLDLVGKADQIRIRKDSVITPLAKDTAKAKKIKLIKA